MRKEIGMARVIFSAPFDFQPSPNVILAYKPGEYTVRRSCADQAIAAGKAVEVAAPRRRASRAGSR